jgi:5'-nucleotidase
MKILVTNDDGIGSECLWTLVGELKSIGEVTVVAPDGERSAIGTAVSLLTPVHVEEVEPRVEGVAAYATDGSPSDCVILALGKLMQGGADIVVSGINPSLNLGEDVHISGTVGAALQGYLRGEPALAISAPAGNPTGCATAAVVAALLAEMIADHLHEKIFLNVNVPDLPLHQVRGVQITRLARASHINTVAEEDHGPRKQYRLVRSRLPDTRDSGTDIQAIEAGFISLTPLYTSLLDKPPRRILRKLNTGLLRQVQGRT